MRKQWVMAVAVLACTAFATWVAVAAAAPEKPAATKVTLQLKWVTQAQFAGYYAALEKGFYDKAGLDVTIKVGGPSITPETVVAGNRAEFGLDWLPNLFATREKGSKLVSIAQVFARSGMTELTWRTSGINTIAKMRGKKVGVWCCGNEPELFAALQKNGIDHSELERRDDRQPAVRHAAVPQEPGRRGGGDDVQRAGAGARDEEPEDRASSTRSRT